MKVNHYQLNIGLENNPFNNPKDIEGILDAVGMKSDNIRYDMGQYEGADERTVVVKNITFDGLTTIARKVKDLCVIFKQECIALEYNGKTGRLVYHPRYKRKRIKFNHKYFIKF